MRRPVAVYLAWALLALQVPLALSLPLREDRYLGWAPFHETATYTVDAGLDVAGVQERYGLYRRLGPDGRDWQTNRMSHVFDLITWAERQSPNPRSVRVRYSINGGPEQVWEFDP